MRKNITILGINSAFHESSACLLSSGKIIAMAEEERFTKIKHAKSPSPKNPHQLPWNAINYCLSEANIRLDQVDLIGYSFCPELRYKKNTNYHSAYEIPASEFGNPLAEQLFYQNLLAIPQILGDASFKGKFQFLEHHDCHAASSYYLSGFNSACTVVIDGIGEFETISVYNCSQRKLEKVYSLEFPNSLGLLWEKFCAFCGFNAFEAGKLMALAAHGDKKIFDRKFRQLVLNCEPFEVNDNLLKLRLLNDFQDLEALLGIPARTEPIVKIDHKTINYAHLVATLQSLTNRVVLDISKHGLKFGHSSIAIAGGVALNCITIGALGKSQLFESIFVQPAANDAGTALGAALLLSNIDINLPYEAAKFSPYLGPNTTPQRDSTSSPKSEFGLKDLPRDLANRIYHGQIIGIAQGRAEIGPRALGNRSIIADPRDPRIVTKLSSVIKKRESYRPVCPVVLSEFADMWFDIPSCLKCPAKYMLATVDILPHALSKISGVVHFDHSARVQILKRSDNPLLYDIISEFHQLSGIPILINTSFNDNSPMVLTKEDAFSCFLSTELDGVVLEGELLTKQELSLPHNIPETSLKSYFEHLR
jgi:carbamoyltransferase